MRTPDWYTIAANAPILVRWGYRIPECVQRMTGDADADDPDGEAKRCDAMSARPPARPFLRLICPGPALHPVSQIARKGGATRSSDRPPSPFLSLSSPVSV